MRGRWAWVGMVVVAACGGDIAKQVVDTDGGIEPAVDAAVEMDAAPNDAAPMDASTATGPCGLEIIPVQQGNAVAFHDLAGVLIGEDTTDANGSASFDNCVHNTSVTYFDTRNNSLATAAGVSPGDTVRLTGFGGGPGSASFSFTPSSSVGALDNPTTFEVKGCTADASAIAALGTPVGLLVDLQRCTGEISTDVDLLAIARDAIGPVGYSVAKDVPHAGVVTGATGGAWVPAVVDPHVTLIPGAIVPISVLVKVHSLLDGLAFLSSEAADVKGTTSLDRLPATIADDYQVTAVVVFDDFSVGEWTRRTDTAPADIALSHVPGRLIVTLTMNPQVVINMTGSGVRDTAVGQLHFVSWESPTDTGAWLVVAPGSWSSVALPSLPPAFDAVAPGSIVTFTPIATTVFEPSWTTYSEVINDSKAFINVLGDAFTRGWFVPIPGGASLRSSHWTSQGLDNVPTGLSSATAAGGSSPWLHGAFRWVSRHRSGH